MVLNWFKWFIENKPSEDMVITSSVSQLEVKTVMPARFLSYHLESKCKTHWEYHGLASPTNNCNECWEYYAQKCKR